MSVYVDPSRIQGFGSSPLATEGKEGDLSKTSDRFFVAMDSMKDSMTFAAVQTTAHTVRATMDNLTKVGNHVWESAAQDVSDMSSRVKLAVASTFRVDEAGTTVTAPQCKTTGYLMPCTKSAAKSPRKNKENKSPQVKSHKEKVKEMMKIKIRSSLSRPSKDDANEKKLVPYKLPSVCPQHLKEAEELLLEFSVCRWPTRVTPTAAELETLWLQCNILPCLAVSHGFIEQLSYTTGNDAWQPRLRMLHALENFYARGREGREIACLVYVSSGSLIDHLCTQVPQTKQKALEFRAIVREEKAAQPVAERPVDNKPLHSDGKKTQKADMDRLAPAIPSPRTTSMSADSKGEDDEIPVGKNLLCSRGLKTQEPSIDLLDFVAPSPLSSTLVANSTGEVSGPCDSPLHSSSSQPAAALELTNELDLQSDPNEAPKFSGEPSAITTAGEPALPTGTVAFGSPSYDPSLGAVIFRRNPGAYVNVLGGTGDDSSKASH
eukprot:gnl/MRDRNA2_/MRDRNA2_131913_c0_seq1.p1 gnl/MRDRNA2_/MRDRNA2_131913_c0~~gnl/MRDRNA2_/MRDRNA2_131913_c0_seq1.p1  ORF type:complete len:491 (+),score=83.89 gnl/MRDRNA2_/MRDRNA2_131913_c0_seq1:106-1578(+)